MTQVKLFNRKPWDSGFNSFLDGFLNEFPVNQGNGAGGMTPVNISEDDKNYQIEVIAPGFDKNDFKINVENDILTISGEKKAVADVDDSKKGKQVRKEYSYRSFTRSFTLDEKINGEAIEARYVNGVLTLNLPKKEEVKTSAKQISIQ